MTDECIQIMGGMGFMKVQNTSLPRPAAVGQEEEAARPAGAYYLSSPVVGAWGRACAPRSSHLPDL